MKEELS
jgi:hypothetical protein